jgi:hypothetical protein
MKGHSVSDRGRKKDQLFVRRDANFDDTVLLHSFVGGMRYGYTGFANWGRGLVTLDIYQSGLELRPRYSFLRFLVPIWRARYDEISEVRWMGGSTPDSSIVMGLLVMVRGVRFTTTDGDYVIFWCTERDQILDTLARRGLKIEAARERFKYFSPDT